VDKIEAGKMFVTEVDENGAVEEAARTTLQAQHDAAGLQGRGRR
jgi:hypothetical protein